MTLFTPDQLLILFLVFLLGLVLGMFLMSRGGWKRRYREEVVRREALEKENSRLAAETRELSSMRQATVRDEAIRENRIAGHDVRHEGPPPHDSVR